jgi:hypothetical protein
MTAGGGCDLGYSDGSCALTTVSGLAYIGDILLVSCIMGVFLRRERESRIKSVRRCILLNNA